MANRRGDVMPTQNGGRQSGVLRNESEQLSSGIRSIRHRTATLPSEATDDRRHRNRARRSPEWRTLDDLRAQLEAELFNPSKGVLLDALASAGVTHVVVTFDGYGDSGQIENVEVRSGDDAMPMSNGTIEIARPIPA